MIIDDKAYRLIANYEGLEGLKNGRYYPYRCKADPPGLLTIGRGHALHGDPKTITVGGVTIDHKKNGLTLEQVEQLYKEDLAPRVTRLLRYIPDALAHEYGAFLSLLYNNESAVATGSPGRLHRELADRKKVAAAFLLYVMAGGPRKKKPILGLWRRRGTEALYYLTGEVLIANTPATEKAVFERLTALGVKYERPKFS